MLPTGIKEIIVTRGHDQNKKAEWTHCETIAGLLSQYEATLDRLDADSRADRSYTSRDTADSFYGATPRDVKTCLAQGDLQNVEASDRIMAMIEDSIEVGTQTHKTVKAVAGGAVNVPALLAGQPMAMRLRRRVMDETTPIGLMYDATVSGAVNHDEILRRGAAALALTRIVGQARPVQLVAMMGLGGTGNNVPTFCTVKIDSAPLDIARAAFVLTRPEFLRRIGFSMVEDKTLRRQDKTTDGNIGWPWRSYGWQENHAAAEFAERLGFKDYVAIGSTCTAHDGITKAFQSDRLAAEWVQKEAQRLLATRDAHAA